jgi:hypothetical protein
VLLKALKLDRLPRSPAKFERFFPSDTKGATSSYLEDELKRRSFDKTEVALLVAPHFTVESLEERFDLVAKIRAIVDKIRAWNA